MIPAPTLMKVAKLEPFFDDRRSQDGNCDQRLQSSVGQLGVLAAIEGYMKDGRFIIVNGNRRLKAAVEAGLDTVPVVTVPEEDALIRRLTENSGDTSLHSCGLEKAMGIRTLLKKYNGDKVLVALKLGWSKETVARTDLLNELTKEQQDKCWRVKQLCSNAMIEVALAPEDKRDKLISDCPVGATIKEVRELRRNQIETAPGSPNWRRRKFMRDLVVSYLDKEDIPKFEETEEEKLIRKTVIAVVLYEASLIKTPSPEDPAFDDVCEDVKEAWRYR